MDLNHFIIYYACSLPGTTPVCMSNTTFNRVKVPSTSRQRNRQNKHKRISSLRDLVQGLLSAPKTQWILKLEKLRAQEFWCDELMHKTLWSLSASMALFQYFKTAASLDSLHHAVCVCVCVCLFKSLSSLAMQTRSIFNGCAWRLCAYKYLIRQQSCNKPLCLKE